MYRCSFVTDDDIEVVTSLRVMATLNPVVRQDVPYTYSLSIASPPSKRSATTKHVALQDTVKRAKTKLGACKKHADPCTTWSKSVP